MIYLLHSDAEAGGDSFVDAVESIPDSDLLSQAVALKTEGNGHYAREEFDLALESYRAGINICPDRQQALRDAANGITGQGSKDEEEEEEEEEDDEGGGHGHNDDDDNDDDKRQGWSDEPFLQLSDYFFMTLLFPAIIIGVLIDDIPSIIPIAFVCVCVCVCVQ